MGAAEKAVQLLEQMQAQLATAWGLPADRVYVDPATERKPAHTFAVLAPALTFEGPGACSDDATLSVGISGVFHLPTGVGALDMMRARAQKSDLARAALSYSAAMNPDVPRLGDRPIVTELDISEPGDIQPGQYIVGLAFTTSFTADRGPFVAP